MNPKPKSSSDSNVGSASFREFISGFIREGNGDLSVPIKEKKDSINIRSKLDSARSWDVIIRIGLRIVCSIFFGWLLWYQNIKVFVLVIDSIKNNTLANLQPIFGILVGATLFETYKISEIMVKWLFKDIDYRDYNK